MKAKFTVSAVAIMMIVLSMFSSYSIAQPTVSIAPDNILTVGEIQTVNGNGFSPNATVRVDLVFPSGSTIEGVATGSANANGTFSIDFLIPDVDGQGYVKVVSGVNILSTIVTFVGTASYELSVDVPENIYVDEATQLLVEESSLNSGHYIVVLKSTSPSTGINTTYWVLHEGVCSVPVTFEEEGEYRLNISIEGTKFVWTDYVDVIEKNTTDTPNGSSTNITFNVVRSEDKYTVNILKEGFGYVTSGTIRVVNPDGSMIDITISGGSAQFTADEKGSYQLQYTSDGYLFLKTVEYSPSSTLTASGFSSDGQTTLTFTLDGKTPSNPVTVQVAGDGVANQITLVNGQGTFSTTSVGTYTFTASYKGVSATAGATYSDTYTVEDFYIAQSDDTDILYIRGKVVGENSGSGKANARVDITVSEIGYTGTTKTSDSGQFTLNIPLDSGDKGGLFGGALVTVEYEYGDAQDSASIVLKKNWIGEYWLIWGLVGFVIGLYLKEKGYIYEWFKILPPKGARKNDDGGTFDDPFAG